MIYVKNYVEPDIDLREISRYAGCPEQCADEIKCCLSEISDKLSYRVCYTKLSLNDAPVKEWIVQSNDLRRNLNNCEDVILFAAGIGIEIDRIISKYSRISPSKALFFQAIGSERIETLCNVFNEDIKNEAKQMGLFLRPRFSPGYGDFSIENQREIFRILDCSRRIGVTLNDSLIMSPSKSVTAVIGLSECSENPHSGCRACNNTNCKFRR